MNPETTTDASADTIPFFCFESVRRCMLFPHDYFTHVDRGVIVNNKFRVISAPTRLEDPIIVYEGEYCNHNPHSINIKGTEDHRPHMFDLFTSTLPVIRTDEFDALFAQDFETLKTKVKSGDLIATCVYARLFEIHQSSRVPKAPFFLKDMVDKIAAGNFTLAHQYLASCM